MIGYETLWTHVSFHLPIDTAEARRDARKFMRVLRLKCGGQNVVVSRGNGSGLLCCRCSKAVELLSAALPDDGELHLVPITDKQVERSRRFFGKARKITAAC